MGQVSMRSAMGGAGIPHLGIEIEGSPESCARGADLTNRASKMILRHPGVLVYPQRGYSRLTQADDPPNERNHPSICADRDPALWALPCQPVKRRRRMR